jgi:uncharacterized protein YwlG (UPF0340 family)
MKTRPTGKNARKIIGRTIGTRDYKPILDQYFSGLVEQARKKGVQFGTHIMRKVYANCIADQFKDKINIVVGKRIDRSAVMSIMLGHENSFETALSYANIDIEYSIPPSGFIPDDRALLIRFVEKCEGNTKELNDLKKQMDEVQKENQSMKEDLEKRTDIEGNQPAVIRSLRARPRRGGRIQTTEESDEDIRFVLFKLREAGIKFTNENITKSKIGKSRFLRYKKEHTELLPSDWRPLYFCRSFLSHPVQVKK